MSLRSRLLIGMGVVALVLIGVAVIVTRATGTFLVDRVDAQLTAAVPRVITLPDDGRPMPGPNRPSSLSALFILYVDASGQEVQLSSPGLAHSNEALPDISPQEYLDKASSTDRSAFTVSSTTDGEQTDYRVLVAPTRSGGAVAVALSLQEVDDAVQRLIVVEVVATLLVLAVLGLVIFWVLRLGVRPIKRMTVTASAIAEGDLSQRIEPSEAGTEAAELGHALNLMLTRIEEAFAQKDLSEERLRQFVADASHELRTPVTSIRGYAELYRQGGLVDDDLAQAMRRMEQESVRMGTLIDDLLLLARLDQGRPLERNPVNLVGLATDAVSDARAVDPNRPITIDVTDEITVLGDEHRLRQVVSNLVGNAMVHTAPGTAVEVRVSRLGDRCVLEVTDHGAGMEADTAAHAFERFYRADPSRGSRHKGGTGLGLAIVKAIVEAHGGWVALDTARGRGTSIRVELPRARTEALVPA